MSPPGSLVVVGTGIGVNLTDAGRVLVSHADVILRQLGDAEAELEAMAGLRGGRLRLVAFPSAGGSIMPEAVAHFRERHPAVEVTLAPAEPDEAILFDTDHEHKWERALAKLGVEAGHLAGAAGRA